MDNLVKYIKEAFTREKQKEKENKRLKKQEDLLITLKACSVKEKNNDKFNSSSHKESDRK